MKAPFDLTGKVFIVTGSGKGIGKGIVRCFVKAGAKCTINCNSNRAMAEETLKEIQAIGGRGLRLPLPGGRVRLRPGRGHGQGHV